MASPLLMTRGLLLLLQGLAELKQAPQLFVMSQGSQASSPSTASLDIEGAALWGFVRSLAKEQPQWKPLLIDVGPEASSIANACNQYLLPTVLCPWGCSEFIHSTGYLDVESTLQRFLQKCNFHVPDTKKLSKARYLYYVSKEHFMSYDTKNNHKFISNNPVEVIEKEKIKNVYSKLNNLNLIQ